MAATSLPDKEKVMNITKEDRRKPFGKNPMPGNVGKSW
jgi:hypothetical protein